MSGRPGVQWPSMSETNDEIELKTQEFAQEPGFSWESYRPLALISGSILLLDQFTKTLVRQNLAYGETWMPLEWLAPYARIVHWRNTGAAFGMFQNGGQVFTILAIVVSILILMYYPRVPRSEKALRLAMSLQLGGAIGNLIDRLTIGHVTDFASIYTFPVFNVADSSITVGVIVLLAGVWFSERQERRAAAAQQNEQEQAPSG